jgi:hypothetical protein
MHLVVGDTIRERLSSPSVVKALLESHTQPEKIIETLFVRVLSRKPTDKEQMDFRNFISGNENNPEIYEDIFWGLLNSTEFLFNH